MEETETTTTTTETEMPPPAVEEPAVAAPETQPEAAEQPEASTTEEPDAAPPRRFKEMLPVTLTDEELATIAKRAAAARSQVSEHEAGKKAAMEEWKEAISEAENERDSLLDAIAKGTEQRMVECVESKEFRTGVITVFRVDTGEKVRERAMSWSERQMTIAGTDAAPCSREPIDADASEDEDDRAEELAAVTPADESETDDGAGEHAIDDPQAVLDAEPGVEQPTTKKKRTRRAKAEAAS